MTPGEFIYRQGVEYSRELADWKPQEPVIGVYNPLTYAAAPWKRYIQGFGATPKRVVFLGMNPGPWGMAQTGVPFGEVTAVREWLGIDEPVAQPEWVHPKRPIQGFQCTRSEVSGRRLWGLFRDRFGTAERFFEDHIVINYCPLVFMGESGRNITPDRLRRDEREYLFGVCDRFLADTIAALRPRYAVGIGAFARDRLDAVTEADLAEAEARLAGTGGEANLATGARGSISRGRADDDRLHRRPSGPPVKPPRTVTILHPSPASPAANRGWAETVLRQLREAEILLDQSNGIESSSITGR
ncbi:MAG: uracil-DNA glycosylase family protein [Alkalispirochaeta sp.]